PIHLAPQTKRTFFVTSVTDRRRLLLRSESLCDLLLDVFRDNRNRSRLLLHEFVIMRDHLHAILTPAPEISVEKAMQFIKGGFSYRAKRELGFKSEIWQPGFTQHRIKDSDDYHQQVEYIWNNPVKAGFVLAPEEFPYSSARLRDRVDAAPEWVKPRMRSAVGV